MLKRQKTCMSDGSVYHHMGFFLLILFKQASMNRRFGGICVYIYLRERKRKIKKRIKIYLTVPTLVFYLPMTTTSNNSGQLMLPKLLTQITQNQMYRPSP